MRRLGGAGRRAAKAAVAVVLTGACRAQTPAAPAPTPAARPATAQYRFEITGIADTTFTFLAPVTPWLRAGQHGIVVDPRRRDVLVARFEALRRSGDSITALVTGQTGRLSTEHEAVVPPPPPRRVRTFRQRAFWVGILTGGALGAGAAVIAR